MTKELASGIAMEVGAAMMVNPRLAPEQRRLYPISLREASQFILQHHRHHGPTQGHKFSIGLMLGDKLVGVAVVGRPVARALDDGWTAEITRVATDGTANACSQLYGAARRAAAAMGYSRVISYTLASESGTSLRAAGFVHAGTVRGKQWSTPSRPRDHTLAPVDKTRWQWPAPGKNCEPLL